MDVFELKNRSKIASRVISSRYEYISDWYKIALDSLALFEPGALVGTQFNYENTTLTKEEECRLFLMPYDDDNLFVMAFYENCENDIIQNWMYNPTSINVSKDLLESKIGFDFDVLNLIGNAFYYPFDENKRFLNVDAVEGFFIQVVRTYQENIFICVYLIDKDKNLIQRRFYYTDIVNSNDEEICFLERLLVIASSNIEEAIAWRKTHLDIAFNLNVKNQLFSYEDPQREVLCCVIKSDKVNSESDKGVRKVCHFRKFAFFGGEQKISIPVGIVKDWEDCFKFLKDVIPKAGLEIAFNSELVFAEDILDTVYSELGRQDNHISRLTLSKVYRCLSKINDGIRNSNYFIYCEDFPDDWFNPIYERTKKIFLSWNPYFASTVGDFNGNIFGDYHYFCYYKDWVLRNNRDVLENLEEGLILDKQKNDFLFLTIWPLLIELSQVSTSESRELYKNLIFNSSVCGAQIQHRGQLFYYWLWLLYRDLKECQSKYKEFKYNISSVCRLISRLLILFDNSTKTIPEELIDELVYEALNDYNKRKEIFRVAQTSLKLEKMKKVQGMCTREGAYKIWMHSGL